MTMLPRLQAEESLLAATRVAVGTGSASDGAAIQRFWHQQTGSAQARRAAARPTAESIERLSASGYGIRKVPMKTEGA